MARYSGAVELTWTNKHQSLLSSEGDGYEWVNSTDHRVSEIRLLRDAGTVGDTLPDAERVHDNLLIRGDALNALASLAKLAEFAGEYRGKVKLVYIDPPFNTGEVFPDYDDNLEHSVWLTMIRDRLLQVKALLAPEGSVWLHCDDSEQHRVRVVLDEVFGVDAFVATVVWQKKYSRDNRPAIGTVHDYIHVYAPSGIGWKLVRNRIERSVRSAKQYRNPNNDPKGPWRGIPMDAQAGHATAAQFYDVTLPSGRVVRPSKGRAWLFSEARYEELLELGLIYFGAAGDAMPNTIRYLVDDEGLVPWTWWPHEEVGHTDESKKEMLALFPDEEPFDTAKPERLMERIIHIASNPGDLLLDCFTGSGTTPAVAHKMARRWAAIEWSDETLLRFAIPRLTKVTEGQDPGGVTEKTTTKASEDLPEGLAEGDGRKMSRVLKKYQDAGLLDQSGGSDIDDLRKILRDADRSEVVVERRWKGGGGFRLLDVAPSMFVEDEGVIYLADWAVADGLAEPVAAQLGFEFEANPPFSGRKGRTRLAVVDGLVSVGVVDILLGNLSDGESVVICGTAVAPDSRDHLKRLSRGSRIRKIPQSILAEYRLTYRRRRALELHLREETQVDPIEAESGD